MLDRRPVDVGTDRAFLLEMHCRGNYESDAPWARRAPYEQYRGEWLSTPQPEQFLASLLESLTDHRTVAEVWEQDGESAGFLWVTFGEFEGYGITFAEVRDIEVIEPLRRRGIGAAMLERAEQAAREHGAAVLRSETGVENAASRALHDASGFAQYRLLYEKLLRDPQGKAGG